MSYPTSHKTVFVLDQSLSFISGLKLDLESLSKPRSNTSSMAAPPLINHIPFSPVTKSIWTCAIEALTEYCRIVWDIFSSSKLIRFYAVNRNVHKINTWNAEDQNLASLMNSFMSLNPPKSGVKSDLDTGFKAALEALTEPTAIQEGKLSSVSEGGPKVLNKGRIVVVTKVESESEFRKMRERFLDLLVSANKIASSSSSSLTINHCDFVLVNFCKEGQGIPFDNKIVVDYSPLLSYETFSLVHGVALAPKLCSLVLRHYELASTTVTGIPMKEEQNASSSANYDVELFHPAKAHTAILKGIPSETAHLRTIREGTDYETVTLKWCTPRSSANMELQHCSSAYRITSVDVNSRPSSCLTNFLLNGRWVMLEMPRKAGGKVISHMLACHGGDIYIHTMYTARSVLEDPPSISEGYGGRVADYRIPEFGDLISSSLLAPHPNLHLEDGEHGIRPIDISKKLLKKKSRIWPMTAAASTFFSLDKTVAKFIKIMIKDNITEDEIVDCKNTIFDLIKMETKGDVLPTSNSSLRGGKGNTKRDEQYKVLWTEVEQFIRTYNETDNHQKVLECLLECQNRSESENRNGENNVDIDQALMEIESNNSRDLESDKRSCLKDDSDGSLLPNKKKRQVAVLGTIGKKTSLSLLSLWENKLNMEQNQKNKEFKGRQDAINNVTPLYTKFHKESKEENKKNEFDGNSGGRSKK